MATVAVAVATPLVDEGNAVGVSEVGVGVDVNGGEVGVVVAVAIPLGEVGVGVRVGSD